ncbi:phosphopantothenoylcysteine decarboxylase [Thraustotheca clavata]|uniref:Phosphopantothenoylcysteine decarboxylase n=1 Tax=Thraustotheca clavata TaxID=74557 RepID=A0A1V9ZY52_9STRA|nr:phosphopantothenoylcysteine decarboxylase [Thraustotheca clavata]
MNFVPMNMSRRPRVLVGASGSVATVKVPEIVLELSKYADVQIVLTKSANFFLEKAEKYNPEVYAAFQTLGVKIYLDDNEWDTWNAIGDDILHIQLREWAEVFVVAPLSANTMAKLTNGICDNLLTCVARAWASSKPLLIAPAMNTQMWNHPCTKKQLQILENDYGYEIIPPMSKMLACGETGNGALAAVKTICTLVQNHITETQSY